MTRLAFMCSLLLACVSACDSSSTAAPLPDGATTSDAPPTSAACGVRTGQRGKTHRTITAAGLDRTYIVYLPPNADPAKPLPLVFVHHGFTMSAEAMFEITGYPELADAEGIALAFPDGQGGPNAWAAPWNVGSDLCPSSSGSAPPVAPGDDFAMLEAIKGDIALDQCIDDDHVFVTGFSMGGYFSHHAGCMRDDIRAIAPHSGGTHPFDSCTTDRKPVIIFHGRADSLVPAHCNDPTVPTLWSGTPAAAAWAAKNGCDMATTDVAVDGGTCRYYTGCPAGGQVAFCTFTGMGHCWAGGKGPSIYSCAGYASATHLEWQFFKDHAW